MSSEPRQIAIGLCDADRETLATLLSLFEDTEVVGMALASALDAVDSAGAKVAGWMGRDWKKSDVAAAALRIENGTKKIRDSDEATELLRLRVWLHIWTGFGIDPDMPVSDRAVESCAAEVGEAYAKYVATLAWDDAAKQKSLFSKSYWKEHGQFKWVPFRKAPIESLDFESAFAFAFQRIIEGVAQGENSDAKCELADRAISYLEQIDEEKKAELLKAANVEEISRESAIKILAMQGGLVGTGIATELAGFSAYILAAKASAIIPFVGGKAMVSTLAVAANPLFIVPAALLVGGFFGSKAAGAIKRFMAMNVSTVLALRGVAAENPDIEPLVTALRAMPTLIPSHLVEAYRAGRDAETRGAKATEMAKTVSRAVWRIGKAAFDVAEYPDMTPFLKKWEVATGEKA